MNRYELDTNHTDMGFTAKHMVFTTVRGRFNEYDGYVEVDGDDFTNAKGEFTLQVASIDSSNEKRDEHLRSADFFNAAEYPVLTFRPTGVQARGDNRYAVTGDLTIREVAEMVADVVGFDGELVQDPTKPDGTPRKLLDVSRINDLGWKATVPLRDGITSTYQWFLEHRAAIRG